MQARSSRFTCAVTQSAYGPLDPFRHLIVAREVIEASNRRVELDIDGARRPVALLADDDLGLAVYAGHLHLPFRMLVGAGPRLLVAQVVFFTEHEKNHVGVLLDRARLAQVRELRPFVFPVLSLPRQFPLRQPRPFAFLSTSL